MIPQSTIDRIIDTAQIVDVVSDFVRLRKSGTSMTGLCPFHNERSPSFHVSPARNICKCFSCGEGGNPVTFIMKHESLSFFEALRWLANKYNIEIEEDEESIEERQERNKKESMMLVSAWAQKYFSKTLLTTSEGKNIGLSYLRERGINDKIIEKFDLGYCPDGKEIFTNDALKQGYRIDYLEATGLTIKRDNWIRDRFAGRVMFPIHGVGGRVIGFGGRTLKAEDKAKYLNSPESEIYHKSKILYGIYQAKRTIHKNDKCFLVEGYTDVLSMSQAGIENVVASSGTALTEEQIRLIKRFTNNITVIYDGDDAGIKAALRGIDLILKEGLNVKVLLLPNGEDPDSFAHSMSASALEQYINENETDFVSFKTKLLLKDIGNDPISKTRLINELIDTISVIPDAITRQFYIQECSRNLKVDENILYESVRKKLNNQLDDWRKQRSRDEDSTRRHKISQHTDPNNQNIHDISIESSIKQNPCEREEIEIIRLLLRYFYDSNMHYENEDGTKEHVMVGDYIITEIENDELYSTNNTINEMLAFFQSKLNDISINNIDNELIELVQNALAESLKIKNDDNLNLRNDELEAFLLSHKNKLISRLSTNLFSNSYIVSRKWERDKQLVNDEKPMLSNAIKEVILGHNLRMEFLNNPKPEISKLTSDLLAEKYMESKRWTREGAFVEKECEILNEIVPKTMYEYKLRKVRLMLKDLEQEIEETSKTGNWSSTIKAQEKYINLKKVVTYISEKLGNRTII